MMIAQVNQSSSTRLARVLKRSSQYSHKSTSCSSTNRWGSFPLTSASGDIHAHSLSQFPRPLTARCLSSSTKVQDEIVTGALATSQQRQHDTWSKWELVLSSMAAVAVVTASLSGFAPTTSSNSACVTATSASTTATTTTSAAPQGHFGWGGTSAAAVRPSTSVVRLSHFPVEELDDDNDQMISISRITNNNDGDEEEIDTSTSSVFQGEDLDVSVRAVKGGRLYMEDEYFVGGGGRFVGVFDGHGGGDVSKYLRTHLYSMFLTQLKRKQWEYDTRMNAVGGNATSAGNISVTTTNTTTNNNVNATANEANDENETASASKGNHGAAAAPSLASFVGALRAALHEIDAQVLSMDEMQYQGSTAVSVTMHTASTTAMTSPAASGGVGSDSSTNSPSTPQRTLVVANVGDSRAILSRSKKAVNLTRDHKPNEDRERARIESMGHSIQWDNYSKVYRVQNLSLSRAIGDRFAKPVVSGQAEITIFPIQPKDDEFVVLASDGLWDVMESDEVVQFIHQRMSALVPGGALHDRADIGKRLKEVRRKNMSRYVASEALKRGSEDNVCVLIIWLKPLDQS